MARFSSSLDRVRVAAPCNVDWNSMMGNERRRFCGQCQLNVYNLSAMTRGEAEQFVSQSEGRVCIRYYQRRDGSILTRNCPVGLQALKRRLSRVANAVVSLVITFLAGVGVYSLVDRATPVRMGQLHSVAGDMVVEPYPVVQGAIPIPESVGKLMIVEDIKKTKRRSSSR